MAEPEGTEQSDFGRNATRVDPCVRPVSACARVGGARRLSGASTATGTFSRMSMSIGYGNATSSFQGRQVAPNRSTILLSPAEYATASRRTGILAQIHAWLIVRGGRHLWRRLATTSKSAGLNRGASSPESKAFIRSFVKEIAVQPGTATIRYTIPTPPDSPSGGRDAAEVELPEAVRSTVSCGWGPRIRTPTY